MARAGPIVGGLLLMLLLAPMLWFLGIVTIFVGGLLLIALAWIVGVVGLVLFIYGLVAPSDLERSAMMRPPATANPLTRGRYCTNCGTIASSEARFCLECGQALPAPGG